MARPVMIQAASQVLNCLIMADNRPVQRSELPPILAHGEPSIQTSPSVMRPIAPRAPQRR
jgi:hypothetical protein